MKIRVITFTALVVAVGISFVCAAQIWRYLPEYRSITGRDNNPYDPSAGEALSPLSRLAPSDYGDGIDLPRGVPYDDNDNIEVDEQTLPSARVISNVVHDQNRDLPSTRKLNQLFFQFGQFLIHDIGLTGPDSGYSGDAGNEPFNIGVPKDDPYFSFSEIPFLRSVSVPADESGTGKREQLNRITAFIDGSAVYGSDEERTDHLRTFYGGRLTTDFGPHGVLLPLNTVGEENANPTRLPEESLFLAGDVRANEQIGLIAIHTLFVREHNRLAAEIADQYYYGADPGDPVVDSAIFQEARARVGAIIQKITYREWLPALLGRNQFSEYQGYDPGIDPQLSNEFSTAAFRIGHTMLPAEFELIAADGTVKYVPLQEAFFNPALIYEAGIDPIFRGFAVNLQEEIDRFVVDGVRNFLFPDNGGGFDLAALNIQRGRDHGLPGYNDFRRSIGLPPADSFADVSPNGDTQRDLADAYGNSNIEALDVWTGGLCEPPVYPGTLGETFTAIVIDQFTRLRDGDRFFFRNRDIYSVEFIHSVENTTLADVIRRNTNLGDEEVNDYTFFLPGEHPYRPDLRITSFSKPRRIYGDDIYNGNGIGQTSRFETRKRRARTFLLLENDGFYSDDIWMSMGMVSRGRVRPTVTTVSNPPVNVTSEFWSGRYRTTLSPGENQSFRFDLRRVSTAYRRVTGRFRFRAMSRTVPALTDFNKAEVRFHNL